MMIALARVTAWAVWTFCLTLAFGRLAAYNLGNYRPVTNDEVELMSVAYKLATQGVVGSDLFAGFAGADQHFFMVLPLQHVLEAISFRLFGAGVAQARWVSLVAGVSVVWLTGWLAYRWYGLATAVLCELLLVAWPSGLTAASNGLPLFGVARVARYDVLAVALAWLAIALLDVTLRRPRPISGFALGVCCGLAALSTFSGTFVLPLIVLNWFWARGRRAFAEPNLYWILAGTGLVLLPWAVVAIRHAGDLAGQLAVFGGRGDFLRPGFYLTNVATELSRYQAPPSATAEPRAPTILLGSWMLAIAALPAVVYLARRGGRPGTPGDRILWSSLFTFLGLLVLLDQTKTPLYAIILVPSLCLAVAALFTGVLRWVWRQGQPIWLRLATSGLSLVLALTVGSDAVGAYQFSLAQADAAGAYLEVGRQIDSSLSPDARVLGPERWWWALHDHPYLSLRSVWFQWTAAAAHGSSPEFADWVTRAQADSIIVNDNVHGDILAFPDTVQQQFWTFINTCTLRVADLDDPTYLEVEVYQILKPPPRLEACGLPP
jgi:4-amino-4-deoxy-L-arabinose transferase-like glycosyltransferase